MGSHNFRFRPTPAYSPWQAFTFLNIPRSYYGRLAAAALLPVSGEEAAALMAALTSKGVSEQAGGVAVIKRVVVRWMFVGWLAGGWLYHPVGLVCPDWSVLPGQICVRFSKHSET